MLHIVFHVNLAPICTIHLDLVHVLNLFAPPLQRSFSVRVAPPFYHVFTKAIPLDPDTNRYQIVVIDRSLQLCTTPLRNDLGPTDMPNYHINDEVASMQ